MNNRIPGWLRCVVLMVLAGLLTSCGGLTSSSNPSPTSITVSVVPATATVAVSQTAQFTATVTGTSNTAVTWSATAGTINAAGLYTAPSTVPNPATVTVTATSVADSTKTGSASVTIASGTFPTVSVTSPVNGASVSGVATLSANASDVTGVTGVQFTVDGTDIGGQARRAPYTILWNSASVANGTHTLTAIAYNSVGNNATSAPITISVSNTSLPPGEGWTQMPVSGTPGITWPYSRSWNRLIYDHLKQVVIMELGTNGCSIMTNSIWNYGTATNSFTLAGAMNEVCPDALISQSNPPWPGDRHTYSQMAYDTKRNGMWMGMGVDDVFKPTTQTCPTPQAQQSPCDFEDMWFWDSATQIYAEKSLPSAPVQPGNRLEGEMEYDPINDVVVLYGGLNGGAIAQDTWIWHPSTNQWSEACSACAPGPKEAGTMIWDPVTKQVMLFGGQAIYGTQGHQGDYATTDIWYYNAATNVWTKASPPGPLPPAVRFPAVAFDTKRNVLIYCAGPNNLWSYDPVKNTWSLSIIPGGPSYGVDKVAQTTSMAYDESRDIFVVHDFGTGNGGASDVWQLNIGTITLSLK